MIVIGTPTRDTLTAGYVLDLIGLLKYSPEAELGLAIGTLIPSNRITLVRAAIQNNASHILFIDSDMRFPNDTLEKLLSHNKDIIGANCRQRTQDAWTATKNLEFISSYNKTGLEEVDTIGMGVTLIDMNVFTSSFRKIKEPWFQTPYHTLDKKLVGEDVYFCTIAKENGFKIWVDHDLSQDVKHISTTEL